MKPTEEQIRLALNYLLNENHLVIDIGTERARIASTYSGYIASFGGSVVQSGLLGTALMYCNNGDPNNTDRVKANRAKLAKSLHHLLTGNDDVPLFEYLKSNWNYNDPLQNQAITNKVMQLAVALKLAIRSYKLDDTSSEND
ncbi:MAG: hypothetical protein JPMHGGIA_01828 [Saprospiraceae bacterium]|nr:hypothetical protein [Saprospiraceae bacterium]